MAGPQVHTSMPENEPEHHGEFVFAKKLVALADDRFHMWFGVDYLPGVTDLDLLLCAEPVGFFAVEVKAFSIDAIERTQLPTCPVQPTKTIRCCSDRLNSPTKSRTGR